MTDEKTNPKNNARQWDVYSFVWQVLLCILATTGVLLISFFFDKAFEALLRNVILMALCCGLILVSIHIAPNQKYLYKNQQNLLGRFCFFFLLGLLLVAFAALIPPGCWPFLPFAVALSLLAGPVTGMAAYMTLVLSSYYMANVTVNYLLFYLFVGLIGILLFQNLGEKYRFQVPLLCSILLSFVSETAIVILAEGAELSLDLFVYPMINIFVSTVLILLFLTYFSKSVVQRYREDYSRLNDPDALLLTQLKEYSPEAYYHAIHTAYFCDKLARQIGADAPLCKAGGYYYKIGKIRGKGLEKTLQIGVENHFPAPLITLIKECVSKQTKRSSKEAAIVLLADAVVSSVMFMFSKDKDAVLDYEQIVAVVFQKKLESGALKDCTLSLQELAVLQKTFAEEKLYYDFLR